jgi:fructokinase
MHPVVTIGDCIIDEIDTGTAVPQRFAGGAGLNLAAGIAKLGLPSALITRFGQDRDGFFLLRHARNRGIRVVNSPTVDATGVAVSTRVNGEPSYSFNPVMLRRRIGFTAEALELLRTAPVAAVNSFPFDQPGQVAMLTAAFAGASGIRIADPNPRPRLVSDLDIYRTGFERLLQTVSVVKMSDEDVSLLYGGNAEHAAETVFGLGVGTVLFSHGAGGVTMIDNGGLSVHVPIAVRADPLIDTMGAGDATLASVITCMVRKGVPATAEQWRLCLEEAMEVAAATCRTAGADLVVP